MVATDLVAIFRSTFHVTKGNIIDWSRTNDDISLEGVEFTSLPSGLHLVEKDVIYFSKGVYQGVCVFHRRVTAEEGQRGSRLFSVGVLVAPSERQRQWEHLPALRRFASGLDDNPDDLSPLNDYFEANQYQEAPDSSKTRFTSWEDELSGSNEHPALHLPHLLRIIGPSSLTLFKYVLARRRVLIHTQPPVEAACVLAQLTSDLAFGNGLPDEPAEGVTVLGIVGLTDVDRLQNETWKRNGWIACTTDAIFLEKPHLYDLVVDLTTLTPSRSSRPNFYTSRPVNITTRGRGPTHRLQLVRYTFSDLRLWGDVERILKADATEAGENGEQVHGHYHYHSTGGGRWSDVWQVYEDVCMVCAGLWIGGWRSSQQARNKSTRGAGRVLLDGGDTVLSDLYIASEASSSTITSTAPGESMSISASPGPRQLRTTLSLLSAFHQHSSFLQTRLSEFLPESGSISSPVSISARDVSRFELGPLSELDGLFLEWLAESRGVKIKIKRGWTDIIVAILGFG